MGLIKMYTHSRFHTRTSKCFKYFLDKTNQSSKKKNAIGFCITRLHIVIFNCVKDSSSIG